MAPSAPEIFLYDAPADANILHLDEGGHMPAPLPSLEIANVFQAPCLLYTSDAADEPCGV